MTSTVRQSLAVWACALMLAGCAPTSAKPIDISKVKAIRPCRTHQRNLLAWFGQPTDQRQSEGITRLTWRSSQGHARTLHIRVDSFGRVLGFDLEAHRGKRSLNRQGTCVVRLQPHSTHWYLPL